MSARAEIEGGVYTYAYAFDQNDMDLLAETFVEDAELVEPNGNVVSGRSAIRESMAKRRADRVERGEQPRHMTTNVLVLGEDGREADVRAYFMMVLTKGGEVVMTAVGHYVDTWVDDGGTWRIKRREMRSEGRG